jgi:formate dehydrogenase major subunit
MAFPPNLRRDLLSFTYGSGEQVYDDRDRETQALLRLLLGSAQRRAEGVPAVTLTRRDFIKYSAAGAGAAWAAFGFDMNPAYAQVRGLKISRASEVRSVCPYCAVGCSMIAYVTGHGEVESFNTSPTLVHIEGDPDSPINGGSLCPKGASTLQLAVNPDRVKSPMYRAPGASEWQVISWEDALDRIARLMKDTRDERFVEKDEDGNTVNRNEGFAWVGGATISNEEGYFTTKLFRALGCVGLEQQARV